MKKLFVILLIITTVCAGCSGNQNNNIAESTETLMPESTIDEDDLNSEADTSENNIDYGTTTDEFLASASASGVVTSLTDSSFETQPGFASADPEAEDVITTITYDEKTVQFKTASIKADGSSFSVSDGQRSDFTDHVNVLVYGNFQDDGSLEATEIIVIEYDYD